jgi:hypothetical protein
MIHAELYGNGLVVRLANNMRRTEFADNEPPIIVVHAAIVPTQFPIVNQKFKTGFRVPS